jgi:DnaJ domain
MVTIIVTEISEYEVAVKIKALFSDTFHELITSLKSRIPFTHRNYDGQLKVWMVQKCDAFDEWLEYAEREHGANVTIHGQEEKKSEQRSNRKTGRNEEADPFNTLHLLPSAPVEVIKAAYKALALIHHPDKGGDLRRMQAINIAYEQLIKKV